MRRPAAPSGCPSGTPCPGCARLRAHHQQAQTVERQVNTTREVWSALNKAVEQRGWPDRMFFALYPAAMGNRVRRAACQADAERSGQQAQRDIRELVRAGSLTAEGEAQGRYYTAGPDLPEEITRGARAPRPLRDPYA